MKNKKIIIGFASVLAILLSVLASNAAIESSGNFFDDFDADGDGSVSLAEYTGPNDNDEFSSLDTDEDGAISENEAPTGPPGGGPEGGGPGGEGPGGGGPGGGGPGGGGPGDGGPGGEGPGGEGPGDGGSRS